jgi:hypothetical protein
MTELCQFVDVCISNEEDAKDVFGIEAEATDIYGGSLNHEGYKSVAKQLADKFGFEMVAITLRESHSAFDNGWRPYIQIIHTQINRPEEQPTAPLGDLYFCRKL